MMMAEVQLLMTNDVQYVEDCSGWQNKMVSFYLFIFYRYKKAVLLQGELRDAPLNFDTHQILL